MALTVAQSGGRPNSFPGVIRAGVKRANKVVENNINLIDLIYNAIVKALKDKRLK